MHYYYYSFIQKTIPYIRSQNAVYSTEFCVYFKAQVRESRRLTFCHVLGLYTLCCNTQCCITYSLYFRCEKDKKGKEWDDIKAIPNLNVITCYIEKW